MKQFTGILNDEHITELRKHILFSGLTDHEIFMFIHYSKPYYISLNEGCSKQISGEHSHSIALVITGNIFIYSIDYEGTKSLLKFISYGESSGTLYSMLEHYNSVIEFNAKHDSEILLINPESLFITDKSLAEIQHKILVNMIASQRQIYFELSEHLSCLSQRNIKDKILKFLQNYCEREHSYNFKIPFSRDEMAHYLAVDRASLSRSLSELKKDGVIDFHKSEFTILSTKHFKY